jgi:hypothetical protein
MRCSEARLAFLGESCNSKSFNDSDEVDVFDVFNKVSNLVSKKNSKMQVVQEESDYSSP